MTDAKTDIKQSEEWQKAVAYEILDSDIELFQSRATRFNRCPELLTLNVGL